MIGLTILSLAAAALIVPAASQEEYRLARPSKLYSNLDDDEVAYQKPSATAAPTPVPILKQINNHNDDGSYTYGFEAADGSFKIETKEANGQVRGKYGYTDANGKLHVVEYGANKFGFQPSGEGITVPPVNYDAEPEEEIEEPEQRITQFKQARRPQAAVQQVYREPPTPAYRAPAVQQVYKPAPAPSPAPVRQAEPHIIYSSPVPKKPSFFAGAQPVEPQQEDTYEYQEQPAPQPRPVPKASRPQPVQYAQPSPVQYAQPRPVQYTQTEAPAASFIPSAGYTQAIQFGQGAYSRPAASKAAQYQSIQSVQSEPLFRPEPPRPKQQQPQLRYTQAEPIAREEPRAFAPRPQKTKVGGFFDQLEEQFALPRGNAQAQHDVSFGFF